MRTDTELLDALEREGCGVALIHDDDKHWFVATDGMQDAFFDGPREFSTTYIIDGDMVKLGRPTAREAIDAWCNWNESSEDGARTSTTTFKKKSAIDGFR